MSRGKLMLSGQETHTGERTRKLGLDVRTMNVGRKIGKLTSSGNLVGFRV